MSQQINLLNPSLIEQKNFPNLNTMAIVLALFSLTLMAFYGYLRWQFVALDKQHDEVTAELMTMQQQVGKAEISSKVLAPDAELLNQIDLLTKKQIMQQHFLSMIMVSNHDKTKMYSEIMRAFAMQSIPGLWLTEFSIDSQMDAVTIKGRALKAEIVPIYIAHLGTNPTFRGQQFAELNMHLVSPEPAATSLSPSPVLSGVDGNNNLVPSTNSASEKPMQSIEVPQLIEFVLKSDKKTTEPGSSSSTDGQKL